MHTLSKFSDGYYLGRAYLTKIHNKTQDGDALINSTTYGMLEDQLFSSSGLPLIFKIKNYHVRVYPCDHTQSGTIELSKPISDEIQGHTRLPSNEEFLVLSEESVKKYKFLGW